MNLSQKVAYNTLVQVFSKIATVCFGLLTTILLTRYLGKEGFGDYMYVITLVVLFGAFADWGTQTIGVREASRESKHQNQTLMNIVFVRLLLALAAAILMVLVATLLPLKFGQSVLIRKGIALGSLITLLFATKASLGIIFQTKLVMQKLAIVDILASFLILLISWFFIQFQAGFLSLLMVVILANLAALILAFFLAKRIIKIGFQINKQFIKSFLKESWPMGIILLVFTVDNKIDTIMLGLLKGSGAVGIYAVSYRIYDVLILGAAYLMNALLPILSKYSDLKQFDQRLKLIFQKTFDLMLLMSGGVVIVTWVMAPFIVRVITQTMFHEFFDSVLVLRILSMALFLAYFNHLIGYTIVALGRQRRYLIISLGALFFNVLSNYFTIQRYSYFGAAVITVLTEGLILIVTSFYILKLINFVPSLTTFPSTLIELLKKKGKIF
ncbi:flippase [Patescibacteria group bacterium]